MPRDIRLVGSNGEAFLSDEREVLLAGPAGTGKTLAWLWKLYCTVRDHPGARVLMCRKTRASLTESAMVTFERDVLGPKHPILKANPTLRRVRQTYRFDNGSEIIVGGMDKPEKTLSTEYDLIYLQEATEFELEEYETLFRALRAGAVRRNGVPFTQIIMDCNPTFPHHWLYKRVQAGTLRMYSSTHRDNPRFWRKGWTQDGRQYLQTLEALTGFRRQRFLQGIWAAAEGLVYDSFGPHNLLESGWKPPADWQRFHAIDFGYTNPLAYLFAAKGPDNQVVIYRQIYHTGQLVEDIAKAIKADVVSGREPKPQWVVGDHDAEDRATFERHSGFKVLAADKTKKAGIQDTAERFRQQDNGKPQLYIVRGSVDKVDQSLARAGKPTCLEEELTGYVWDSEKDEPVKENDHAADALRYMCRRFARGKVIFL